MTETDHTSMLCLIAAGDSGRAVKAGSRVQAVPVLGQADDAPCERLDIDEVDGRYVLPHRRLRRLQHLSRLVLIACKSDRVSGRGVLLAHLHPCALMQRLGNTSDCNSTVEAMFPHPQCRGSPD